MKTKTNRFYLLEELNGQIFQNFMEAAVPFCTQALLVVRDDAHFKDIIQLKLETVKNNYLGKRRLSKWPGTTLFGHDAIVYSFDYSGYSYGRLGKLSKGIFRWGPFEDFSLSRADGSVLLTTISHEEIAYLDISDNEYDAFIKAIPALKNILIPYDNTKIYYAAIRLFLPTREDDFSRDLRVIKIFKSEEDADVFIDKVSNELYDAKERAMYFVKPGVL